MHRNALLLSTALLAALAAPLGAQGDARPARGLTLTLFRSPATGLEVHAGRLSVHGGHYPTILRADGDADGRTVHFLRVGATWRVRRAGVSPFVTPSLALSLDDAWRHGALTEVGVVWTGRSRLSVRAGGAVLTTLGGEVRVNPTVGLGLRLGKRS